MAEGILNLLKPSGMSSHDCIYELRRILDIKKIGHSGTLDPIAAGVLPIYVGRATRLIEYSQEVDKSYRCEIKLGFNSDTDDAWGNITKTNKGFKLAEAEAALLSFLGVSYQRPPDYSAVRKDGVRLYKMARQGEKVEVESRQIEVSNIKIIKSFKSKILFDIDCSRGTYVRSICRDVGEKLGCGALMNMLIRTKSGGFVLEDSMSFEEIRKNPLDCFMPIDSSLKMSKIELNDVQAEKFIRGMRLKFKEKKDMELAAVYASNKFLGIGKMERGILSPKKVII